jgi:hypothetical protein
MISTWHYTATATTLHVAESIFVGFKHAAAGSADVVALSDRLAFPLG